jgi:DNA-binding SARP family transcriptional activator/tetratricopeptide (TPR) repeat protein
MIELHTLGDAVIKVGTKEVRPTSPMVFAALLYLCVERGRRVPRAALQELLFPEADERSGAHSLRQLLYKLRRLGVPIEADAVTTYISGDCLVDFENLEADQLLVPGVARDLSFLPGFSSGFGSLFEHWLEGCRSAAAARVREVLLRVLNEPDLRVNYAQTQRICESILTIDAFNEEATVRLARALALSGQKRDAMLLLDSYLEDVGKASSEVTFLPSVLRRRIFEHPDTGQSRIPLVGRNEELAWLLAQNDRAMSNAATVTVLWGEAGIGKTRLTEEFVSHILLKELTLQTLYCQPHDANRPLGVFLDLVPRLLALPGALGISPDSMMFLKAVSGPTNVRPRQRSEEELTYRVRAAILDLLASVAAERPLVLIVEDCHWVDDSSLRLLLHSIPSQPAPIHVVLTYRGRPASMGGLSSSVFVRQLAPLSRNDAMHLLSHCVGNRGKDLVESLMDECLALADGNPLFVRTIAEHLNLAGSLPKTEARITDLLRQRIRLLDPGSLLLLRCVAALAKHCTDARLTSCHALDAGAEMLALQQCAHFGLINRGDEGIRCSHDLVAETVITDCPHAVSAAIYRRVATLLEDEGSSGHNAALLWSCAEAWRLAGDNGHAARVLESCASYALQIGQPAFALMALEESQRLWGDNLLPSVVERAISAAELAYNYPAVLRNVDRIKSLNRARGKTGSTPHGYELAEINALRRCGRSIWHLRETLTSCALDNKVDAKKRIKAARIFLVAAELNAAAQDAQSLYDALDHDALSAEATSWCDLSMIYHAAFGDCGVAGSYARRLLTMVTYEDPAESQLCGNAATFLYRAGELDDAVATLQDCIAFNRRFELTHMLSQCVSQLTLCYIMLGDWDRALTTHEYGETLLADAGHAGDQIANRVDFALKRGDCAAAIENLAILRAYDEAKTPVLERTVIGYDLIIAATQGRLRTNELDLERLRRLDASRCEAAEHQVFAIGFGLACCALGLHNEAHDRWRHYVRVRRERFPLNHWWRAIVRDRTFLRIVEEA